jgi:hypothetical protein
MNESKGRQAMKTCFDLTASRLIHIQTLVRSYQKTRGIKMESLQKHFDREKGVMLNTLSKRPKKGKSAKVLKS